MPVREVAIAEHWDAALPLMAANWRETGFGFDFRPARQMYEDAQARGVLLALGAFHDDELVGYCTAVTAQHPFNPEVIVCSTDALYVIPAHRKGTLPGRLIFEMERIARRCGARFVLWHTRAGTPLAAVMDRHGYTDADVVKIKELA